MPVLSALREAAATLLMQDAAFPNSTKLLPLELALVASALLTALAALLSLVLVARTIGRRFGAGPGTTGTGTDTGTGTGTGPGPCASADLDTCTAAGRTRRSGNHPLDAPASRWGRSRMLASASAAGVVAVLGGVLHEFVRTRAWLYVEVPLDPRTSPMRPASPPHQVLTVPSDEWTPELLHSTYKFAGLPVHIPGAVAREVATGMWTPEALASTFGSLDVQLQVGNVEQHEATYEDVAFGTFLTHLNDSRWLTNFSASTRGGGVGAPGHSPPYFAEENQIFREDPRYAEAAERLVNSTMQPSGAAPPLFQDAYFWVGPAGTRTGLHTDWDAVNILHQLHGSKKVTLFAPVHTPFLYPNTKFDLGATMSNVDPYDVDDVAHPNYHRAAPVEVTLRAGDALFVPMGWFHFVQSLEPSVSVSGRSASAVDFAAAVPSLLLAILHRMGLHKACPGCCACHNTPPRIWQLGLYSGWHGQDVGTTGK